MEEFSVFVELIIDILFEEVLTTTGCTWGTDYEVFESFLLSFYWITVILVYVKLLFILWPIVAKF